jgi:hypothetical protein
MFPFMLWEINQWSNSVVFLPLGMKLEVSDEWDNGENLEEGTGPV